jgi:hypothetical protein
MAMRIWTLLLMLLMATPTLARAEAHGDDDDDEKPADDASKADDEADGEAPAEEEAPTDEEAPADEEAPDSDEAAPPADDAAPADGEAPADEAAPDSDEAAPADGEAPADEAAPTADDAAPADEPAEDDGSAPPESKAPPTPAHPSRSEPTGGHEFAPDPPDHPDHPGHEDCDHHGHKRGHHPKLVWGPPLTFQLPNDFELRVIGRLQVRATLFDMDDEENNDPSLYGDPNLREGFSLRRVRLGLGGTWKGKLHFRVSGGWDNRYDTTGHRPEAGLNLQDAWFAVTPHKELGVRLGLSRVPHGRQTRTSSARLAMPERALPSEYMGGDREPGMTVFGAFGPADHMAFPEKALQYALSISNGTGDWTGDADPKPRVGGRVSIDLFEAWDPAESGYDPVGFALSFGGGGNYHWGLEATTLSVGGDVGVRLWRISLQGEVFYSSSTPTFDTEGIPELLAETDRLGWYAQLGFIVVPGWLELAARVESYDDRRAIVDGGDRLDVWGGANFLMLDGRIKASLFYVHRSEKDGHQTPNDSLILQWQARL